MAAFIAAVELGPGWPASRLRKSGRSANGDRWMPPEGEDTEACEVNATGVAGVNVGGGGGVAVGGRGGA